MADSTPAQPAPTQPPAPTQQPSASQQNTPNPAAAQLSTDSLVCQWQSCGERCPSAEQLYDHVCERHVGRKSTNNLNLTCQWGNCRTTTVKRDHITSHIRVHVPLKPHKCDFCGKAFKRPQDLKKHVKTHADDSVLLRSPEPNRGGPHGNSGYPGQGGKLVADLQALAATASGYQYPDGSMGHNGGYAQQHPGSAPAGFYGGPPQNSAYGPVYYAVNPGQQMNNDSYEMRKRAVYDALNEFLGDAKRRSIDPNTYYDVGQRLMGLQGVQLPVIGGYQQQGGMSDYSHGGTMVAQASHPPMHPYSLPLPNLRTKSDLLNIDSFLEQLQSTVYENPNHAAAAGVQQAGVHSISTGAAYRNSHSPPSFGSAHPHSSHVNAVTSSSIDTPALTPASSVLSYSSQHSPGGHSGSTISPTTRTSMGSMYPTLPSVSAMSDMSAAAPSSGLASAYDIDGRRRPANLLQKAAPDRNQQDEMETSNPASPKNSDSLHHDVDNLNIHSPKVDPALSLRSPSAVSSTSTEQPENSQQSWVENIRTIERLRAYLKDRLEAHDYSSEDDDDEEIKEERQISDDERNLYPVLRAVQEGRE